MSCPGSRQAGTERHVLEILTRLDRRAFTPTLYCLRAEGDYLLDRVRDLGVPIVDGHLVRAFEGPSCPEPWHASAASCVARERPWFTATSSTAISSGRSPPGVARVPVALVSKRSLDTYPKRLERWSCRVANRLADCVTAPAESVRRHVHAVERCRPKKIVVIPNGVDLERFRGVQPASTAALELPGPGPILGSVGRLSPKKGQATLLEAAALVLRRRPDVTFVLVGDGPQRAELGAHAERLGLDGRLRFLGLVEDPIPLLPRMDIFVLPSHMEGMSNALLEAMAAGRPVVATNVGGNAEVVQDGVTGLLVPPRDPQRLAEALLTLLDDPARAAAMGAAGRPGWRITFRPASWCAASRISTGSC